MSDEEDFRSSQEGAFREWARSDSPLPFDGYARHPDEFPLLKRVMPELKVISAGGFAVFQSLGFIKDFFFHLRSEAGQATLMVGDDEEGSYSRPHWYSTTDVASEECNPLQTLALSNFEEVLLRLMKTLQPAPFRYELEGWGISDFGRGLEVDRGKRITTHRWASSPEEALALALTCDEWLASYLRMSQEVLCHLYKLQEFTVVNGDDRVIPELDFTILDI